MRYVSLLYSSARKATFQLIISRSKCCPLVRTHVLSVAVTDRWQLLSTRLYVCVS